MSAVVIDSGLVHYEAFGRGDPVLFLHGWLGSWRYWMRTMESVADRNRTYALDLWGFGDSDKSKADRYTVSDYVTLVDNFINNMGIRDTPIIGHALGAAVALEYAVRYPDRVQKVMAVSLPMNGDCINPRQLDFDNTSVVSKVMRWGRQTSYKEVEKEAEKTDKKAIKNSVQSVKDLDIQGRIHSLSQLQDSVLLAVYGEKDDVVDPTLTNGLNSDWPNIRPIGLAEAKHFPMLDQAAKFNRLLKDFLEVENDLSVLELKDEWRRRTR